MRMTRLEASLLPSFVFGSMRFVTTIGMMITAKCSDCSGTGKTILLVVQLVLLVMEQR